MHPKQQGWDLEFLTLTPLTQLPQMTSAATS